MSCIPVVPLGGIVRGSNDVFGRGLVGRRGVVVMG